MKIDARIAIALVVACCVVTGFMGLHITPDAPCPIPSPSPSSTRCSANVTIFMVHMGKRVPDYFAASVYNKMQMFPHDKVVVYHDAFRDARFSYHNIEFIKVDFVDMLVAMGYGDLFRRDDEHRENAGDALRKAVTGMGTKAYDARTTAADLVRLHICHENCFYFDYDTIFFKRIAFDFFAYEPVESKTLNNGMWRLTCENNRFLHDLRARVKSIGTNITNRLAYNIMWTLWDDVYPDFGSATILEIPIIHLRQRNKSGLAKDMKFFARYGHFWHCYDKADVAIVIEEHRRLFPDMYNDAVLHGLKTLLKRQMQ